MLVTGPIFSGLEDIFSFPVLSFGAPESQYSFQSAFRNFARFRKTLAVKVRPLLDPRARGNPNLGIFFSIRSIWVWVTQQS